LQGNGKHYTFQKANIYLLGKYIVKHKMNIYFCI
jgi:hypothetical protein